MLGRQTIALLIALAVALVTVSAGGTAVVSSFLKPVYEAESDLLVQPIQAIMPGEGVTELTTNQITQTYSHLLVAPSILASVIHQLRLDSSVDELSQEIQVTPVGNTTVLEVTVRNNSPRLAASIANTLVGTFVHTMANISGGQSAADLRVISRATVPGAPSSPNVLRNATVAAILSLIALLVIAVLVRAWVAKPDVDRDGSSDGVPILGEVPHSPSGTAIEEVSVEGSAADDAYRRLRMNLDARLGGLPFSILVSSWGRREGRSRTAANLAVAFAVKGARPVIVDADLRSPSQGAIWGSRGPGLSEFLMGEAEAGEVSRGPQGVDVVAAGWRRVGNPVEALSSPRLPALLQDLRVDHEVVIVDSPAAGLVSDALVLAGAVDAVLLVADTDPARRGTEIGRLRERFHRAGARVIGVVLNDAFQALAGRPAMGGSSLAVQIRLALDGLGRL